MSTIAKLNVEIGAQISKLKKGLEDAVKETKQTVGRLQKAFQQGRAKGPDVLAGGVENLGKAIGAATNPITIAAGAVAGLGAAVASSVPAAAKFEEALTNVASLGANTADQMNELRSGVLQLAGQVGEGATELTSALYDVVSAGYSGKDALNVLRAASVAAKAGLTDTKTAADLVTTALNAYGLEADKAGQVTDIVQTAVKLGKTTWEEMANALGRVVPTAASVGVGMDELSAAVAALTSQGIATNEAVTGLKAALSNIIKPSAEAEKLAEKLGLKFDAQALQAEGLAGVLEEVKQKTGGNTEQMAKLFGSVEALNTVLALTSESGAQKFQEAQAAMQDSAGATQQAFEEQQKTFEATKKRFGAAVDAIKIQVGSVLLPVLTGLLDWFTKAIATVQDWYAKIKSFFGRFASDSSETTSSVRTLFAGMGEAVGGIFNALAALWDRVLKPAWDAIAPYLKGVLAGWVEIINGVLTALGKLLSAFGKFLTGDFTGAWKDMKDAVKAVVDGWVRGVSLAFQGLGKAVSNVWDGIKNGVRKALNYAIDIVNRFIAMLNRISIDIPSVNIPGVGEVGGGKVGFNIPKIPALAEGGIVTKPTLALIGEAGPEAVVPLGRGAPTPPWVDAFGEYVERLVNEGILVRVGVGDVEARSSFDLWAITAEGA